LSSKGWQYKKNKNIMAKNKAPLIQEEEKPNLEVIDVIPEAEDKLELNFNSPITNETLFVAQNIEKYGIDNLALFLGWAADVVQYISESQQDGKFSWVEKGITTVKFIGGLSNFSTVILKKIALELEDISPDETVYLAKLLSEKMPMAQNRFEQTIEAAHLLLRICGDITHLFKIGETSL
jgi:hypothetical protein